MTPKVLLPRPSEVPLRPKAPVKPAGPWEAEVFRDEDSLFESAAEVHQQVGAEPLRTALWILTAAVVAIGTVSWLTSAPI